MCACCRYLYQVLCQNEGVRLPAEALYIIRYHSLYPWRAEAHTRRPPIPAHSVHSVQSVHRSPCIQRAVHR